LSELRLSRTKSGEAQLTTEEPEMAVTENSSDMAYSALGDADRYELSGGSAEGGVYVSDCALESDLGMYFPDSYVPGSSERMLLYRELDNLETEQELEAYRLRLIDRFGPVPHEGEELMQVVALRRLGKMLGCEKIILRQGRMQMQFVSRADSPYYQSSVFERVLAYATANLRRCQLKEVRGRRLMQVEQVPTVKRAVGVLQDIENGSAQ
jgi:transcription-repair coupling factor (superfamily II helicase)